MKHSIKDKRPRDSQGFARGKTPNWGFRKGPITIEDILAVEVPFEKEDLSVREMSMRTDPTNESSPTIKRRFRPLDNPTKILEVLQAILIIKAGVTGNNVTTGPNQYAYWRQCLAGEALRKFNEFATNVGNETSNNLVLVEQRLVSGFTTKDILSREARYIRYDMYKPKNRTTRQYVGAVHTLNETLAKLPPLFNSTQKIPETELLDILASKAPTRHKAIMIEHGFDPQTASIEEFVEISERAETKEALESKSGTEKQYSYASDSSNKKPSRSMKSRKKYEDQPQRERKEFYCKQHGPNSTHNSRECKTLINQDKPKWNSNDNNKRDYNDSKSKYKNKIRDMNAIHQEAHDEKEKWIKANKTLQAKLKKSGNKRNAEDSSSSDEMPPLHERRNKANKSQKDSSSDSSSSLDPSID
jgi:hypothetical protein